jgi:hypothetical protein
LNQLGHDPLAELDGRQALERRAGPRERGTEAGNDGDAAML